MSEVQNKLSTELVEQFNRPLSLSMITKGQDWRTRQVLDYEASKGFLKSDFLGLKDWEEQMKIFCQASVLLNGPLLAIKGLIPRNRNMLFSLRRLSGLGWVGGMLTKIHGFEKVFVAPQDILQNSNSLKNRLGL